MKAIEKVLEVVGVSLMATICVVVFTGVVFRYGLRSPLGWIEEIARYALVWVTYVGSFLALRRGRHLSIDVLVSRANPKLKKLLDIAARLVMLPLFLVMVGFGGYYAANFFNQGTPYFKIPLGIVYSILPVIGVLLVLEIVTQMVTVLRRGEAAE